jgi:hypothetical protein
MIGGNDGDRAAPPDEPGAIVTPAGGPATFSNSGLAPITGSTLARGRETPPASGVRRDDVGLPKRPERERPRRAKPPGSTPEPAQMLDLSELPETYGKDEVGILSKDPLWYFVYWEVTAEGEAAAREQLGPSGEAARLMLRLFITVGGPQSTPPASGASPGRDSREARETRELRDVTLPQHHGRKYLEAPRPGALVRAAVGLLSAEGYFAPIAHSAPVRMPPQQAAPQASVEWLHVLPAISEGHKRERIIAVPPPEPHEEHLVPTTPSSPAGILAEQAALFPATPDADPGSSTTHVRPSEPGSAPASGRPGEPGSVPTTGRPGNAGPGGTPSLSNGSGGLG